MPEGFELCPTADGSVTLRTSGGAGKSPGDTYHSTRGAIGEARHVFIDAGFLFSTRGLPVIASEARQSRPDCFEALATPLRILEMGFGTGLNAWLTLLEAESRGVSVDYTGVELHPVPTDIAARLGYTHDPRFMALHEAPWGEWCAPANSPPCKGGVAAGTADGVVTTISPGFRLRKFHGPITDFLTRPDLRDNFNIVYWDAFSPDTQPELWSADLFAQVFNATAPGGTLVTYSAKGDVKRALRAAGFTVERLPGALGKRHMVRAARI
jgi:tRNA U34 5-methylaminomethyl-2-thiouridine-forming methyltransferase MnmC